MCNVNIAAYEKINTPPSSLEYATQESWTPHYVDLLLMYNGDSG